MPCCHSSDRFQIAMLVRDNQSMFKTGSKKTSTFVMIVMRFFFAAGRFNSHRTLSSILLRSYHCLKIVSACIESV